MPFDLSLAGAAWLAFAVFGAALVRGYSGFGFSALVVAGSALVTNPLNLVAVVMLCEMVMSLQAWRGLRGQIDWRVVRLLMAGALIGLPPGLWLLVSLSEDAARAAISLFILAMCVVLGFGWRMRAAAGGWAVFAAGVASGAANAPGMGGLPVAAFFAAQPIPAGVFRATLVAFFPLLDLYSAPLYWLSGLLTWESVYATLFALPLIALGNHLGSRRFLAADPKEFRKFAIGLLAVLAAMGLGKALI